MVRSIKLTSIRGAASSGFRNIFQHSQPYIHHTYVALGEDGCYYIRYLDDRTGRTFSTSRLSAYPGLETYLRSHDSNPVCVALGEDGNYFFRSEDGASAWCLPQSIEDDVEPDNDDNPVEHLYLGKDNAYYARLSDGATRWNMRGNYGSLDMEFSHLTSDLLCLGMNLEDDRSYFLLTRDGVRYNAGRAQLVGRGLTPQTFNTWVERFRSLRSG